jgi:hypothetical protein
LRREGGEGRGLEIGTGIYEEREMHEVGDSGE